MGAPRTAAGHTAAKLKSTLLAKLGGENDEELLRSVQLCDRFLNSCNNTDAGLAVLKDEVRKILAGKDAKTRRSKKVIVTHTSPRATSNPGTPKPARPESVGSTSAPSTPPWMLPAIRMQGRAHISDANPYHQIARNLAGAEMTDDQIRKHNKALRMQKTRELLDGQMKEVAAQRAAEVEALRQAKEDSDRQIRQHWELTMAERKAGYEHAMGIRKQNEAQLSESKRRQAEARARAERESAVERARSEEEKRRAEAERVARKREQEEEMRRAAEENRARLQLKMEERQREQDENLRIARQQIQMAEEKEAKRLADLQSMRDKMLATYRAAGGEARELDLAAKAAADAERAERQAAEYARKQDEDLRRRKLEAKERTDAQFQSVDEQLELALPSPPHGERSESDEDTDPPRLGGEHPEAGGQRSRSRSGSQLSDNYGLAAEAAGVDAGGLARGDGQRSGASSRRPSGNGSRRGTEASHERRPSRRPSRTDASENGGQQKDGESERGSKHGERSGQSSRRDSRVASRRGTDSGERRRDEDGAALDLPPPPTADDIEDDRGNEDNLRGDEDNHEDRRIYEQSHSFQRRSFYDETMSSLLPSPGKPGTVMVTEVDLKATAQKLRVAFNKNTMQYMDSLGTTEWKARPSLLQNLLKRGRNTLGEALRPSLEEDGLYLARFDVDGDSNILPRTDVPQVKFQLNTVKGIPTKVLPERRDKPQLRLARVCLWDTKTSRFHGNVHSVVCTETAKGGATWQFEKKNQLLLRSTLTSQYLDIYIEFNVSYALTGKEADQLPATHRKAALQVDELTVAWALISFPSAVRVVKPSPQVLPLMCGRLLKPIPLSDEVYAARKKRSFLKNLSSSKPNPVMSVKFTPVMPEEGAKERCSFLPDTIIADSTTAVMVACYRAVFAAQLCRVPTYMSTVSDPVVATFPTIMDDPQQRVMLHRLWDRHVSGLKAPTFSQLVLMFRQVVTMMWPAAHAQAVPQSSIMNFNVHQSARMQKLATLTGTHPVVSLSHGAYHWLHRPFDAQELSYSYSDELGPSV